jgi:hypothetical protein
MGSVALVMALSESQWGRWRHFFLLIIFCLSLVLQREFQPFDTRRFSYLNRLEALSVGTICLSAPTISMAQLSSYKEFGVLSEVLSYTFAVVFILLVLRMFWTVAQELVREVEDAAVYVRNQVAHNQKMADLRLEQKKKPAERAGRVARQNAHT